MINKRTDNNMNDTNKQNKDDLKQASGGILPFQEIHVGDYCSTNAGEYRSNYIYEVTAIIDDRRVETIEHKMKSFDIGHKMVPYVDEHITTPGVIMDIVTLFIVAEPPSWIFIR